MLLDEYGSVGMLQPAIVISVAEKQAQVFIKGRGMADHRMGRHVVGEAPHQRARARAGAEDARRKSSRAATWCTSCTRSPTRPPQLAQIPEAESALVALDPNNGAIMSLVGGFDYFDRPRQIQPRHAWRSASRVRASSRSCTRPRWRATSRRHR